MHITKILFAFLISFFITMAHTQVIDQVHPFNRVISGEVSAGYIFITPTSFDSVAPYPSSISILDSIGDIVFFKAFTQQSSPPYPPALVSDFKLQPSGLLSYSRRLVSGGIKMFLLDSNFNQVDNIQCVNDTETDGHDFIHLEDGSYHLVGTEERIMDLSNLTTNTGQPGSPNATVVGNVLQRFDAEKNLNFEWKSLDHFALDDVYSHFFTTPGFLDHSHFNSLDIDNDGNYIISFRHLHEITKIDSSSGEIIWRFGGKQNQFTFLGDTMPFSAQHDARRLSNGNLTLFDNGAYNSTPVARAIEYQLDEENNTATAIWQFPEPNGLSSQFIGSTQRQSNGNTLIDWGGALPLNVSTTFTEVDNGGNVVMELDFVPQSFMSYRALKYHLPFDLNRPEISCDGQNKTLIAPAGYNSYEWSTGATSQSITVTDTGNYQVWVNRGIGFICSEPFHVSNLDYICSPNIIREQRRLMVHIYPNPVNNRLFIEVQNGGLVDEVNLYNQLGQHILHKKTINESIELSGLRKGFYIIEVISNEFSYMQKIIVE